MKHLKFLEVAVNIEDLTKQQALLKYTLLDVEIHKDECNDDKKSFGVYNTRLPPNPKEKRLCMIPMTKFNKARTDINKKEDCIFAKIDKISFRNIYFTKRSFFDRFTRTNHAIDHSIKYAVRFIPNRITHDASINAIKKINECDLEDFFENFKDAPYHKKAPHRFFTEEEFKWLNPKIASNKEQTIAITNIVNSTAFPFPYIIFGPPGNIPFFFHHFLNLLISFSINNRNWKDDLHC